jgi:hypothetical protein
MKGKMQTYVRASASLGNSLEFRGRLGRFPGPCAKDQKQNCPIFRFLVPVLATILTLQSCAPPLGGIGQDRSHYSDQDARNIEGDVARLVPLLDSGSMEDRYRGRLALLALGREDDRVTEELYSYLYDDDQLRWYTVKSVLMELITIRERECKLKWARIFRALRTGMVLDDTRDIIRKIVSDRVWSHSTVIRTEDHYIEQWVLDDTWTLIIEASFATTSQLLGWDVVGFPDLRGIFQGDQYLLARLVHYSPALSGSDFDPLRLIRSVNALKRVGKEEALRILEAYADLADRGDSNETNLLGGSVKRSTWLNIYGLNERRIFPILLCLFEYEDKTPRPALGTYIQPLRVDTPSFPVVIVGGIPFLLISGFVIAGGQPDYPMQHIGYFERHAEDFRMAPLIPTLNPDDAMSALMRALDKEDRTFMAALLIGRQASRLFEGSSMKECDNYREEWGHVKAALERMKSLKLQWDHRHQRYRSCAS